MNELKRIFVTGHKGLVGGALKEALMEDESVEIVTASKGELDLRNREATLRFFMDRGPFDWVFLPAAVVGGIHANTARPVEFLDDNLRIASSVMAAAATYKVGKLMFFGSSCIYPKEAQQPLKEESLLTGPPEPTNQWYAIAKIAGLKLAEAYWRMGHKFISVMPCNLYGPGDNYDPKESHVIPGMIHKFHHAKMRQAAVELFGDGTPLREFLHVEDLARACLRLMEVYTERQFINIGSGFEVSIEDLAVAVAEAVGYDDAIIHWNTAMPNGTQRKVLNSSRIEKLGWQPKVDFRDGLRRAYQEYLRTPYCSYLYV